MNIDLKPLEAISCFRAISEVREDLGFLVGKELRAGTVLDGRFTIGAPLARSGMAVIYRATDSRRPDRTVAIKVPYLHCEADPLRSRRFQTEAEIAAKLDHPFLLKFLPVEGPKSRPYHVMEHIEGRTLAELLEVRRPLPEADALEIAALVCVALEHMHERRVIHRDLKPGNIMLCGDGTIRVIDFGIAATLPAPAGLLAHLTPVIGTPDYMAPEQVENGTNDARTDLYSLGAVLYELLTGVVPFPSDDPWGYASRRVTGDPVAPRKLNPALSPQAEEIVLHALQRAPAGRFQSAAELGAALAAPDRVALTGYCDRLQAPRWRLSFQTTPMAAGALLGVSALAGLTALFFLLRFGLTPH